MGLSKVLVSRSGTVGDEACASSSISTAAPKASCLYAAASADSITLAQDIVEEDCGNSDTGGDILSIASGRCISIAASHGK